MGKKTMFLLAVAMLMLLPSQVRAEDSPQQSVDLTTRMARTTHDGLRKVKILNHSIQPLPVGVQQPTCIPTGVFYRRDKIKGRVG